MANKWKYADLPASERLDMIKNGNKDVYDNEVERTLEKIKINEENGISTDDQIGWLDTLSYNYNLGAASQIAPGSKVNKTGYANVYFGIGDSGNRKTKQSKKTIVSYVNDTSDFDREAKEILSQYTEILKRLESEMATGKEWLINNGIDKDSETGKKYLALFEEQLESKKEKYYKEYVSKVKALAGKHFNT